jgi:hypothetical protein
LLGYTKPTLAREWYKTADYIKREGAMEKFDVHGDLHCWILVHMERKE